MATRLPTRDSLGQAPSGRSGRPIATYDVTAIGKGMQALGRGIAQAGSGFGAAFSQHEAAQEQVAKFDTELKFQEFKWNETRGLDEMLRTVEPGQADGLADEWASGYQERAKSFFESVPDKFKPTYDQKLFGVERQGYGTTATFQRQEQKRFQLNKIEDLATTYSSRAGAGEPLDGIRQDYQDLLDASPWLTPIEKDEVFRKGLSGLEEAHVRGRLERGEPLEDILRDLRGGALLDTDENPELRAKPFRGQAQTSGSDAAMALISTQLETGKTDPLEGVSQVARDSAGSKSYGNFGLNSRGGSSSSAAQFAREYGEQFGLTAKPGTAAFDRQWRNAAGAAPVELHEAEMAWYARNITSGVTKKLVSAGVPENLASDGRVQAYFADRMIQQGPASIDGMKKHSRRISAALAASDGDPVAFLTQMTELDRGAIQSDFPTALRTGVYSQRGHDRRVDGRLELALGVDGAAVRTAPETQFTGPYQGLTSDDRNKLIREVQIGARNRTLQEIADGAEQIRRTGEIPTDENGETTIDKASRILTRNQFEKAKVDWQSAGIEYEAMNGLNGLTEAELVDRVAAFEPTPNDDLFAERAKVYDKLTREVNQIRTLRDNDPARSVSSIPDVQVAEQGVKENPGDPEFVQQLAAARVDAQASVGIPEGLQSPITKQEARVLMAPTKGLERQALYDSLEEVQAKLKEQYGPYARTAAARAFEYDNRGKETAEALEEVLNTAFEGLEPSAAQVRRLEVLTETDRATRAFGGDFVGDPMRQYQGREEGPEPGMPFQADPSNYYRMRKPPQAAINALKANPQLADEFDAYYGSGSAERAMTR